MILAGVVGAVVCLILLTGAGHRGRNFQPARCPDCGAPAPAIRSPTSARQMLWGGWTCRTCDCEMDRRGRRIAAGRV